MKKGFLSLMLYGSWVFGGCPSMHELEAGLHQINAIRANARWCGALELNRADPLAWNALLYQAAELHATDMRLNEFFSHASKDGRSSGERIEQAGYVWSIQGENLASGQTSLEETLQAWLQSAPHCETLMQPVFRDMGLACAEKDGRMLWVLEMARPMKFGSN